MALLDDINLWLRDHTGYTGDGQGGNGALPVGDRSTARFIPDMRDLRNLLVNIAQTMGDEAALQDILATVNAKADVNNSGKLFPSRQAAVDAGQADLRPALSMIITREDDLLAVRTVGANTDDPLFPSHPFWGVVLRVPSRVLLDSKADLANSGKVFASRQAAVSAGQGALVSALGLVLTREDDSLVVRSATAAADDPLFGTSPYWGVVLRAPSRVLLDGLLEGNLFSAATVQEKYFLNTATGTAALSSSNNYWTSDFIPVTGGQSYAMPENVRRCWYTAALNDGSAFISGADAGTGTGVAVAPANAKFLRIGSRSSTALPLKETAYVVQSGAALTAPVLSGQRVRGNRVGRISGDNLLPWSLPVDRLGAFQPGKNLFNPAAATVGFYDPASDEQLVTANATYCYSDYIPVVPGQQYMVNTSARFVAFYGANLNKLPSTYSAATNTFTVPSGVYFARVSVAVSSMAATQVERGAASTTFEEYQIKARTQTPDGVPITYPQSAAPAPGARVRPANYGFENLREARQRLRSLRHGKTGATARLTIGAIGDSWTHNNGRWTYKVAQALWKKYGGTGEAPLGWGIMSFGGLGGALPNGDVGWNGRLTVTAGTFTTSGSNYGAGGGPDICQAVAAAGATARVAGATVYSNGVAYRLLAEGGAGSVRWSWDDGVTWQPTVDLSAMAAGLQSIPMTGKPTTGQGAFVIQAVTDATLYAVVGEKPATEGILFHKLGATGTETSQWVAVNAARWQAGIANLAPDLVTIMHGTNDQTGGRTKAAYKANVLTIINRTRAARPACDILLIAPCENQRTSNQIAMSEYADALYELAVEHDLAFLDLQPHFGVLPANYAAGSSRPWFNADGIHPEPEMGGYAITDAILGALGERSA